MEDNTEDDRPPRPAQSQMASDDSRGERRVDRGPPRKRKKLERKQYGSVSHEAFYSTLTLSTLFLVIVSTMALSMTGTVAGSVIGSGFGGFVAEFGVVEADQGTIFPVLDEQPACENAPQLMAMLRGNVTIQKHVQFYKDLPLPAANFTDASIARISMVSNISNGEQASVQNLDLRMTALTADRIRLGGSGNPVELREFGPGTYNGTGGGGDEDRFSQNRSAGFENADYEFGVDTEGTDQFYLEQGKAAAHHVSFGSIELPDTDLFILIGNDSEFDNPALRVVEPNNRTCSALAAAG